MIDDYDVWFHLAIGREVLRAGAIPAAEFYKWPLAGQPTGFHEWGFGVLAAVVHRAGGVTGLTVMNAALGAFALLLVAAAALRRGAAPWAVLVLLGPLAFVASYRFCYRPESILYVAFGATLLVLEHARRDARWLLALPLLTVSLALFHPSPLILLLVAGCHLADALLVAREPRRALPLGGAILCAAAVVALAPHGLGQLTLPVEFAARGDLPKVIAELKPALTTVYAGRFLVLALLAAAALALVRPRRLSDALLLAGFGYLAFAYVRNLTLFSLVIFGPAALSLTRLATLPAAFRRALVAASLAGSAFLLVGSPKWGVGVDPHLFPHASADFIERHRPPGRLLNEFESGGYFAWRLYPRYQVAVDGRTYYGVDLAMRTSELVLSAEPGWRELVEEQGVTLIFTPGISYSTGELARVLVELDRDPAWELRVAEDAGMLFVRRGLVPGPALPKDRIWAEVRNAAGALAGVGRTEALLARGTAHFKLRDFSAAAADFSRYAALVPEDEETAQIAATLRAAVAGDPRALARAEAAQAAGRRMRE